MKIAESFEIWMCVIPAIVLVIIQAFLFAVKAYKAGLEIGMTKGQLNAAIRASAVSSVGPAVAVVSTLLALLVLVGGPIAWYRLAYIGNVLFETLSLNFGIIAAGATPQAITTQAFVTGVWIMVLGSIPWIIFSVLFTDKMDYMQEKLSGGDPHIMKIIAASAMVGGLGSLSSTYVVQFSKNTTATLAGAAVMAVICAYNSKAKLGWLREWSLAFALLGGVLAAVLL